MNDTLVVGASRGIGLGLTQLLADKGRTVYGTSRNEPPSVKNAQYFKNVDVRDFNSLNMLSKQFKPQSMDVIYHIAGINPGNEAFPIGNLNNEHQLLKQIQEAMEVNLMGCLKSFSALEPLLKDGGKFVVLTTSLASIKDNKSGGHHAVRLSKVALNMAVKSLLAEKPVKKKGLMIPLLHPGFIKTDMSGGKGAHTVRQCCDKMVDLVDEYTVARNGELISVMNNRVIPW